MTQAAPVVHTQAQPMGEAGVNFSLMKVAEFATAARKDPIVVACARRIVRDSGADPRDDYAVVEAVYNWMQANGIAWLRDPVRVEFLAAARHFIFSVDENGKSNDDALMVMADCDELTLLLLGLCLAVIQAVGVEVLCVLGHSYNKRRLIGHVLGALWARRTFGDETQPRQWWRFDPSSKEKFGWYKADFSREKMIAVPSCREFCDQDSCASGPRVAKPPPLPNTGDFVGLSGVHDMTDEAGAFVSLGDPEQTDEATATLWHSVMSSNADEAQAALDELDKQHASMLGVLAALGADPLANPYGWGPAEEDAYQTLRRAGLFIVDVHRAAARGDRPVGLFAEDNRYAIGALETDNMAIDVEDDGVFAIVKSLTVKVVDGFIEATTISGVGVGAPPPVPVPVIVAGVVLVALLVGGYFAWIKLSGDLTAQAKEAKQKAFADLTAECVKNNTPEKCAALIEKVGTAASSSAREDRKRAEAEASRTRWQVGGAVALTLLIGAAGTAGWWELKKRRRLAA